MASGTACGETMPFAWTPASHTSPISRLNGAATPNERLQQVMHPVVELALELATRW